MSDGKSLAVGLAAVAALILADDALAERSWVRALARKGWGELRASREGRFLEPEAERSGAGGDEPDSPTVHAASP